MSTGGTTEWPTGGGEMHRRVRTHGWASTPLGPLDAWSPRLRSVVELMLAMPQPAYVAWGPGLAFLYNDAYVDVLGARHPHALGQRLSDAWSELGPACRAAMEAALAGQARCLVGERLPLEQRPSPSGSFTSSLTPLRGDGGGVAGLLCVAMETARPVPADEALRASGASGRGLVDAWARATREAGRDALCTVRALAWPAGAVQAADDAPGWLEAVHPDDRAQARREWAEAVAARCPIDAEYRIDDGRRGWRWTNIRAVPLLDGAGGIREWVGMHLDIHARKEAEAALAASQQRQAFLLRLTDLLRPLGDAGVIQAQAARLLGEHLGVLRVAYGEVDGSHIESDRTCVAHGGAARGERFRMADFGASLLAALGAGTTIVIDDVASDHRLTGEERQAYAALGIGALVGVPLVKGGRLVAVLSVHADGPRSWTAEEAGLVEETAERTWSAVHRARAEEALLRSEQRLAAIFANASVGLSEVGSDSRFEQVNDELCRILGRPREALVGASIADVTHPDDLPHTVEVVARARDSGQTARLDKRYLRPDGSIVWAHSSVTPFRGPQGANSMLVVTIDLTDRKAAEAAREESELLLRQFSEASSDVLWIRDARTLRLDYLSPAYEAVFGDHRDGALQAVDGHWANAVLPGDRDLAIESMERVRAGERVMYDYRIRRRDDGAVRWLRTTSFPLFDTAGRVHRVGGISQDLTGLKATEERLARSEARLRTLIQGVPQLLWRANADGQCSWASPQWRAFTGQQGTGMLGLGWLDVVHADDRERTFRAWEAARVHGVFDVEHRIRRAADGAYVWHRSRSQPARDVDGRIVEWLGTSTDVQELKELQQRQEVLVAELQHRTRNLIGVVRSIADRTAAASESLDGFREHFRDRLAALARVQGLLSQRDAGQKVTFDQLLRAELGGLGLPERSPQLHLDGPPGIPLRSSTVQTFALALHELATNAVKYGALATQDGRLAVRWRVEDDGSHGARLHVSWHESGVEIDVHEHQARRGYGRELIERALPYQLRAETSYSLGEDGVHCELLVPLVRRGTPAGALPA